MKDSNRLKYFEIAKKVNSEQHLILRERELHCRGNLGSVSLISVSDDKAEKGFHGLHSEKKVLEKIDEWEIIDIPKRETPEKRLQAWMIKSALNNKDAFLPLEEKIKLITSEMSLKHGGKKVVTDLLGYNENGLFIIELKSERAKKRLIEQVEDFQMAVKGNSDLFLDLLMLHGHKWDGKSIKKVIVWPLLENPETSNELASKGIIEYGYQENGGSFSIVAHRQ